MSSNNKNNKIPFLLAIAFICIIFITKENKVFFDIIKDYYNGDLYVTYEDFPSIGDWIQIVTTILFSYLLWKATCESNVLNNNNLNLQKKLIHEEDLIKYIRLEKELRKLRQKVKTSNEIIVDLPRLGFEKIEKSHLILFSKYELSQWAGEYINVLISKNQSVLECFERIEVKLDQIETFLDMLNTNIADKENQELSIRKEANMIELLVTLSKELEKDIEVVYLFLKGMKEFNVT